MILITMILSHFADLLTCITYTRSLLILPIFFLMVAALQIYSLCMRLRLMDGSYKRDNMQFFFFIVHELECLAYN